MTRSVLMFSLIATMLLFSPTVLMAQTQVGVETETKAEVGVKVGSESSAKAEGEAKAKGEVKSESEAKSSKESETKSESSSESKTTVGNMQVTSGSKVGLKVGLPSKYPMPSVSASNSFVVQTNQHLYKPGDSVTVEGSVWAELLAKLSSSDTVTVKLLDKQKRIVHESESEIQSDGKFAASFMMPDTSQKGAYTITTTVNTDADLSGLVGIKSNTSIGASTKVAVVPPQVFKITVENHGDFDVKVASNSTVSDVKFNGDQKKVSVTVEGESGTKGVSHISIPKSMVSGDLVVMIDGKVVADDKIVVTQHTEAATEVEVNYNHSKHTIDVVGTQAVPEFGTVAVLILVVAIVSVIAISSKSKIALMPRL